MGSVPEPYCTKTTRVRKHQKTTEAPESKLSESRKRFIKFKTRARIRTLDESESLSEHAQIGPVLAKNDSELAQQ